MELAGHAAVGVGIHHVVGEAGAVVVVGSQQALLLQLGGDVDGGPRRQIAALAVAGDAQLAIRAGGGHLHGVGRGALLRRYGGEEAHVEVLLPAHQRGVGSHEGHQQRVIRQQVGHGVELHLLCLVHSWVKPNIRTSRKRAVSAARRMRGI